MKLLLAATLALGLLSLPSERAAACSCAMFGPEEAAVAADVVFAGTVVDARPLGLGERLGPVAATVPMPVPFGQTLYAFAVDGVAKGTVGSQAEILAGGDGGSCGMSFGIDERWLVFATWDGSALVTNLCAGNMVLEAGAESPLPLTAPTDAEPVDAGISIPLPILAVLGVIGLVVAVSWLAFRRDSTAAAS
jgi:hypothetical protein